MRCKKIVSEAKFTSRANTENSAAANLLILLQQPAADTVHLVRLFRSPLQGEQCVYRCVSPVLGRVWWRVNIWRTGAGSVWGEGPTPQ